MSERRRGLGRGLGALIPSAEPEEQPESAIAAPVAPEALEQIEPAGDTADEVTAPSETADRVAESVDEKDEVEASTAQRGATRRPVDVFFDGNSGELKSRERQQTGPSTNGTREDSSRGTSTEKISSKPRSGKRSVSAEALQSALERDSRRNSARSVAQEVPPVDPEDLVSVDGAHFAEIPVGAIAPNRRQPRSVFDEDEMAELVHSISAIGVLQPIVVRPVQDGEGQYELVMGERRWRATQRAGLDTIPAIVRSTDDTDMLRDALLENLHRSQLNPLEEAAAYRQLLDDFSATHDELAARIGRSRPQISNTLRLLALPPLVQRRVAAGVLSAGHARALLTLSDAAEMEQLAQRIVAEGLSVRAAEEAAALSDGLKRSTGRSQRNTVRHERLDHLADSLSDYLDTTVKVQLGARKGKVSIEFGNVDDLNRIMELLNPSSD